MENVGANEKVVKSVAPAKKKKGTYGLAEVAAFVDKNPGVTSRDIGLLKSWSSTLLGVRNTVKKDVDTALGVLKAKIQVQKTVISVQEGQISNAKTVIAGSQADIVNADSQIDAIKKLADLFGA